MTMDRMVEYLENRGFKTIRERDTLNRCYNFIIEKDGLEMERPFHYPESDDPYTRDNIQKEFLNGLIEDFSKETVYTTMFNPNHKFAIKNVIFNPPATIVFWEDCTKTIVKAGDNDIFDPEKGLAMAITKKALGNEGNYYNVIRKWVDSKLVKF